MLVDKLAQGEKVPVTSSDGLRSIPGTYKVGEKWLLQVVSDSRLLPVAQVNSCAHTDTHKKLIKV